MRKCRLIETGRCYHLISRIAHRAFFLTPDERTRTVDLIRRVEEFSGVLVLAYAVMTNHIHIYIYVPEAESIGEEGILRRIKALYRDASLSDVLAEWCRLRDEEMRERAAPRVDDGYVSRFARYKESFLRRMWNSAEFMRTFKQHFTMSYNGRREHFGTMWEGRYHERNHKPEESAMWKTSGYVDANPVKAGIVNRPEDYRWCSFAAACAGDEKAQRGYAFMYGASDGWEVIREKHEASIRDALDEIASQRTSGITKDEGSSERMSKSDPKIEEPREFLVRLERGDSAIAERILELLAEGPKKPALLREAVGIKRRDHFNNYYLVPLLKLGLIEQTDPEHPRSPQQKYRRVL